MAGALSGEAIEHLKVIYNYVENVILACGAPDAFDIYEVCFETFTKLGSFLQHAAPRELLIGVLENVHEVYDVLLSCVETYEWVQPGATGLLRLYMLQVVFVCFGSATITGRTLMELTDNDVSGAVSLVSFVLRCAEAPFEMQQSAGRCLVDLTTADSVFLSAAEGGGLDGQNQQIAKLTGMLNKHVNGLIKGIIQFETVEAFGRCICQHQMSHVRTDIIVKSFLTTVHNSLLYCSENQKKFRQHLSTQSTVVQDIMIPYVHNILPALYDNPGCGPHCLEWQNLKSALQTFVVVTFNINVFRPQLCQDNMIPRICDVPNILPNISMLELLIKLSINVDFTRSPHHDTIFAYLSNGFANLPPESQERLRRRLSPMQTGRLPYAKSSARAIQELAFVFQGPGAVEEEEDVEDAGPAGVKRRLRRKNLVRRPNKSKSRKRKRLFAMQKSGAAAATQGEEDSDSDDDDDMPPLIPAGQLPEHYGAVGADVPSQALCELTGALMMDPVQTPDGHIFERAAIEDWFSVSQTNPATGGPLQLAECAPHPELQHLIQGYQMQMFATSQIAPEAFDEPPTMDCGPPPSYQPPMQAAAPGSLSLLGDLPILAPPADVTSPSNKKSKGKIHITSRSVVDCPDDMRCAIDGKVLITPLRSPYGHYFEKKTLEKWFGNCGSICPVTGSVLRMEDCQPDGEMKKRVVKFLKGEA